MRDRGTETSGNLWFALPRITPPPGGIQRIAFLTMKHRGLIELDAGNDGSLISAGATCEGQSLFQSPIVQRKADWIPHYTATSRDLHAELTWLTPHETRGWMGCLSVLNRGNKPQTIELVYALRWARTSVTTYEADPLGGHIRLMPDGWGGGIGLGWVTHRTEFGMGVGCSGDGSMHLAVDDPRTGEVVWSGDPARSAACDFPIGARCKLVCERSVELAPGESARLDLFASIASDTRAACLDARYLKEQGYERLERLTRSALQRLNASIPAGLQADSHFGPLVRRNRLFTYFYSLGRTLDTEEIAPVTSRSSDYYVSAGYWDRDSLLWSFPAILDMDEAMARQMLTVAFGRQGRNIGTHSRFIDGSIYEQGFELDELCAPILALGRYIEKTTDVSVLSEPCVRPALRSIERILATRRHPSVALYSTDYLPTDDIAELPYCIYDNVLVWRAACVMARIETLRSRLASAADWQKIAKAVKEAIWSRGVVDVDGHRMFAWSIDLKGRHRVYDEPPGSLALLAWHGFVRPDDSVFRNTCAWIYSQRNEHYFRQADEIGCRHEPHPWVLAIANSLLLPARRDTARSLLRRCSMDNGLACEAIDENTGEAVSGLHFATCAGFLANALVESFGGIADRKSERQTQQSEPTSPATPACDTGDPDVERKEVVAG